MGREGERGVCGEREVEALLGRLVGPLGDVLAEGGLGAQLALVVLLALRNCEVFLVGDGLLVGGQAEVAQLGPLIFDFHF